MFDSRFACAVVVAGVLSAAPAPGWAQAVDAGGVAYPPTVALGGNTLKLNGAGVRYKFVVKVYAAGLYLTGKATTPEQVFAMPGPKRMHITTLRELDANDFGRLFTKALQDNASKEDFSKSISGVLRMADAFSAKKHMGPGETFGIDWLPGTGTQIMINGKPWGEPIKEPEFYNAMLRIWLGHSPVDSLLKDALLGQERRTGGSSGQP